MLRSKPLTTGPEVTSRLLPRAAPGGDEPGKSETRVGPSCWSRRGSVSRVIPETLRVSGRVIASGVEQGASSSAQPGAHRACAPRRAPPPPAARRRGRALQRGFSCASE